ncbi:MAG: imidazole glycerol phosphate synthase subunit HisH [Ignavibacteria bacterium]
MIVVIDYQMGNVGSIVNMVKKFTREVTVSSNPDVIENADKLILPGVGTFDRGILNLQRLNLINLLNHKVLVTKTPILGICLGMQIFTLGSEEGTLQGLGWIDAETVKFKFDNHNSSLKIPHMGWNYIQKRSDSPLSKNLNSQSRFYFLHSYYLRCKDENDIILTTQYGIEFTSAIQKNNIYGVQFHPEKSHRFGLQLMRNFVEI